MRRRSAAVLLALLVLPSAGCGDDGAGGAATSSSAPAVTDAPTTVPAEATEVFRYEAIGGCQMMGPNCATYVIYSDGSVEVYRTGENKPAELTGQLEDGEIDAFLAGAASIDFEALAAEVGPGTCNACVDGIDVVLTMALPDKDRHDLTVGAGYRMGRYNVDFGVVWVLPGSRNTAADPYEPKLKGSYDITALVTSLSLGARFGK